MRTVQYGGDLQIGDFIAICYTYGFDFGWYCGEGRGTLQFYQYRDVKIIFDQYNLAKNDPAYYYHEKANREEFNKKWIRKSYILNWEYRVMKIENPEFIFTEQKDLHTYRESKQILEQIKFI